MKHLVYLFIVLFCLCNAVQCVGQDPQRDQEVAARIGEEVITQADIDEALNTMPERSRARYRPRLLRHLIELRVFSEEAEKIKLMDDPQVKAELEQTRKQVLVKWFVKKFIIDKVVITDKEIEDYYKAHEEEFVEREQIRVREIWLKEESEAKEVLKQIKDGTPFDMVLAKEKSVDPSRGGDKGWVFRGQKEPAYDKVAFSLKPGEVSDIIKSNNRYYIIKVVDKKGGEKKTLSEASQWIKRRLRTDKIRSMKQEYYKKADVEILETQEVSTTKKK